MLRLIPLLTALSSTSLVRTGAGLVALIMTLAGLLGLCGPARAQSAVDAATPVQVPIQRIVQLVRAAVAQSLQGRLEVVTGQLDPRLKLAACASVEPYLPAGTPAWGHTRVGLHCVQGAVAWNVSLPITVHVWGEALVATVALPAGTELTHHHVRLAEIDLAATGQAIFTQTEMLIGRRLATAINPGTPLRAELLRMRQWFAAGEAVTLTQRSEGYTVSTQAQALGAGIDGQPVRVKLESGAILVGTPVGHRMVEVRS